jgi:hypothetical protein
MRAAHVRQVRWRRPHIFGVGLVPWLLSAVVTYWTGNPNLLPTLVLLGSFLLPWGSV